MRNIIDGTEFLYVIDLSGKAHHISPFMNNPFSIKSLVLKSTEFLNKPTQVVEAVTFFHDIYYIPWDKVVEFRLNDND